MAPRRLGSGGPFAAVVVGAVAIAVALGGVAVFLPSARLPGTLTSVGSTPGNSTGGGPNGSPGTPVAGGSVACNPVSTPTPSSVLLPIPNPSGAVGPGGTLSATIEFAAVNYTTAPSGITVFVPSAFATFPLSSGGTVQLFVATHSFSVSGAGWANGSTSYQSTGTGSGLRFSNTAPALLSTQKIAVLADSGYGTITLEVRWHWTLTPASGGATSGPWSVPTTAANWPASVPSIFYPAPRAALVSENGPNETIGNNFTAELGGNVSGRYFFLELEAPSTGKVAQSHGQTARTGVRTTNVTIPMLNYDRYLYPGSYLVHIHDACGAMLLSLPVTASYSSAATVLVHLQPASCGPVTFQGRSYGNNASISVAPSSSPYSIGVPTCSGHPFRGWQFSGGIYLYSSSQLLVSSSGSFTVLYS